MFLVAPNYFDDFFCIADRCKHSCCVGWEIDIDEDTYALYGQLGGFVTEKIQLNGGVPSFRLTEDERCPFLNENNLCELIIKYGENGLCDICADHPRFRNYYSDRVEIGLGLCCEAAAELILGRKDRFELVCTEEYQSDECLTDEELEFFAWRNGVFAALQNRDLSLELRFKSLVGDYEPNFTRLADFMLELERLDKKWETALNALKSAEKPMLASTEYEQLALYFAYRHLPLVLDGVAKQALLRFVVTATMAVAAISAELNENIAEVARLFSSEIEYSDENLAAFLDFLK